MEPSEFRYKITSFVDGVIRFENGVLLFKQGLRSTIVPISGIDRFGYAARGGRGFGMLTSELLVRETRVGGTHKLHRMPFDANDPQCQGALAMLRTLAPHADTTHLAWPEAAALLGENPFGWRSVISSPMTLLGFVIMGAGIGASSFSNLFFGDSDDAEGLGRSIGYLLSIALGLVLVVVGIVRTRRKT